MENPKIYYKHFIVNFDNLEKDDENLNIFICKNSILDIEKQNLDNKILYIIKYIIIPEISDIKSKNKDLNKKIKDGESVNYYADNDYLKLLKDPTSAAYYRYCKDIRNLIAEVIGTQSAEIMTNYMIYIAVRIGEPILENLKKTELIPEYFFEILGEMYMDIYNSHKNDVLSQYLQNNSISAKMSRQKKYLELYNVKYNYLKGCYKDKKLPLELKRLNLSSDEYVKNFGVNNI